MVDDLEWDVKVYFAVNAAVHDAAVGCWGTKRVYDSARPISMIRYMGERGQSSDPERAVVRSRWAAARSRASSR